MESGGARFELFKTSGHQALEDIQQTLGTDSAVSTSEISCLNWSEEDNVIFDELATFFPFPRQFNREWQGVKDSLRDSCQRGRLIVVRSIAGNEEQVDKFVDCVNSVFSSEKVPQSNVTVVLEDYPKDNVGDLSILPLEVEAQTDDSVYSIQVSGKRNHTYYVNLALRVFQRRDWINFLELSGLGNAIPSIVSIAEILKRYQVAVEHKIETSLVELDGESRPMQKAKMVVVMRKIASVPSVTLDDDDDLDNQV